MNADEQVGNAAEMVVKYGTEEETHRPSRVRSCSAVIGFSIISVIVVSPMNKSTARALQGRHRFPFAHLGERSGIGT